jgi:hypothetical protein
MFWFRTPQHRWRYSIRVQGVQWGAAPLSKSRGPHLASGNNTKHEAWGPKETIHINHSFCRSQGYFDVQPVNVDIKGHKQQICKSSAMHQVSRLG